MQELAPRSAHDNLIESPDPTVSLPEEGIDLRAYWGIICKHSRLLTSSVLASLLVAGLWMLGTTPLYTAKSTILIERSRPQILNTRDVTDESKIDEEGDEFSYYKTQFDILKSRRLAAQVIIDVGLANNPAFTEVSEPKGLIGKAWVGFKSWIVHALSTLSTSETESPTDGWTPLLGVRPALIDKYLDRLNIQPEVGTRLVFVEFTSKDPVLSARVANMHVRDFIRRGIELHVQASNSAEEFLQAKLVELKKRIEKSEAALNSYRRDRGIVTLSLNDKGGLMMNQLNDMNSELTKTESLKIALEAQHELIRDGNYESLPAVINSAMVETLKQQTTQLAVQYASMSNRFNPGYHPLDDLKAKLDESQRRLEQATALAVRAVEADYRAAESREKMLQKDIEQLKAEVMNLNEASLQDAVLVRQVNADRELYKNVLERMSEIGISADVPTSNISVVDEAEVPHRSMGSRISRTLVFSAGFSLFGAVCIALLVDFFDDRLTDEVDVTRYLGVSNLALVPDFGKLRTGTQSRWRYMISHRGNAQLEGGNVNAAKRHEIAFSANSAGAASEAYRLIRAGILFSRAGSAPRAVLITSAEEREGKTLTAINTSIAFAQMHGAVLLIDADLRKPRCHEIFDLENHWGLSEVLTGQAEVHQVIRPTKVNSLHLLSSGTIPPDPSVLLSSKEFGQLLNMLSEKFDYVFLDSAPVMAVSDTLGISVKVDGVVLVVGRDTSRRAAVNACSRLRKVGAKIYGAVLNQTDLPDRTTTTATIMATGPEVRPYPADFFAPLCGPPFDDPWNTYPHN
jgi:polysaccharide biosynthesis transport protein